MQMNSHTDSYLRTPGQPKQINLLNGPYPQVWCGNVRGNYFHKK